MNRWLRYLTKRRYPYEPLITVNISRSRLVRNLEQFAKLAPGATIAPVLKSNAYGHGLLEVAWTLEAIRDTKATGATIPFFVVDSYFEAIALRAQDLRTPILIIGFSRPEMIVNSRLRDVSFTITSLECLQPLCDKYSSGYSSLSRSVFDAFRPSRPIRIHLKIDTGMHRQGLLPNEIDTAIPLLKKSPFIILEGITSHLSDADNHDQSFTKSQIELWNTIVKKFKVHFPSLKYIHLCNTDGHRYGKEISANVSRLGIGLYGLVDSRTFGSGMNLLPVLEMKTIVTGVKRLKQGDTVGYGNSFVAKNDMTIATIPVGYFEGIDRRLSAGTVEKAHGVVLVGDMRKPCPIIGRVSMNITTIDVSNIPDVKIGIPVVVFSRNDTEPNTVRAAAAACDTISYEIAVKIPTHLKRNLVD